MTEPNKHELVSASLDANKQPPAEAGECAVAYILRNEYDEYRLEPVDGMDIKQFPVEQEILLYTSQTTATQAAVAAAMRECVSVCKKTAADMDEQAKSIRDFTYKDTLEEVEVRLVTLVPAEATAALEKICMEVAEGIRDYYEKGASEYLDDNHLRTIVTSVIEKGK